ncbi:hypothetical protein SCLCIDRAFT_1225268, partial [Scleroderma citrinum Foug A]
MSSHTRPRSYKYDSDDGRSASKRGYPRNDDETEHRRERDRHESRRRESRRDGERRGERSEHDRERDRTRDSERRWDRDGHDGARNGRKDSVRPSTRRSASPGVRRRSRSPTRPTPTSRRRSRSRSHSPSSLPPVEDKAKPNFNRSGLLAAATNTVRLSDGTRTVLKYNEPPEARKPTLGWRLYVFKGENQIVPDPLHINSQSAYLIGRDPTVAEILVEHPSCSKQHAVIQHRQVQIKDEFGVSKPTIKPFVIDLESTNHTQVNDETIPTTRFYELQVG